jgi:ubiquinone/menaquinone biosynthesis C-methylase UbiE
MTLPENASQDPVHRLVAEQYAAALERAQKRQGAGCCGGSSACGASAALAGYEAPSEGAEQAAAASFGCGNPLSFAEVLPGQTVIDLGSGAGYDLLLAAQKVGPEGRVIGIDMTDAMLEAARNHAKAAGAHQVQLRKGLIEAMPVAAEQADWVISNCVINLSPDKPKVFAEIARVLKTGGQFRISDIVAEDLPAWLKASPIAYAACVAGALPESLYLQGLRDAGLVDVAVVSRLVYDPEQIRALVETDFADAGLEPTLWNSLIGQVSGKVASVTVTGRKPEAAGCGCAPGCC